MLFYLVVQVANMMLLSDYKNIIFSTLYVLPDLEIFLEDLDSDDFVVKQPTK